MNPSSATPEENFDESRLGRDWALFMASTFLFVAGFYLYNGIFQNFLKDRFHVDALQLGIVESLREIPGFLAALIAGLLIALHEGRVMGLGLFVAALGIMATGVVRGFEMVIAVTVFWSVGFHAMSSVSSAITLALARGKEGGRHLGRMSSVGAMAQIAGLGFAWVISHLLPQTPYATYFWIGGAAIMVSALLAFGLSENVNTHKVQPIVLRREYGLYYLLIFLEGCRRQIFAIFATFTLISVYKVPLDKILLLQFVNAALIAVTAPRMGRLIDRIGEKTPLTVYAVGLLFVFIGYATIHNIAWLYALYIIDNVLFTFGNGFTTYLHRIVRPGDLTPTLAMGVTFNHIAAVTVPFFGALLWKQTGNYEAPFLAGIVIVLVSFVATRYLPAGPRVAAEIH